MTSLYGSDRQGLGGLRQPALVSDQAASRLAPSGFDQAQEVSAVARKARIWAEVRMVAGKHFVDRCPYVRSGWAIWERNPPYGNSYCLCREVPKTYAELLTSGMETRQGGDVKQAPSRSDDSPTAEGGDAQKAQPIPPVINTGESE